MHVLSVRTTSTAFYSSRRSAGIRSGFAPAYSRLVSSTVQSSPPGFIHNEVPSRRV